MANPRRQLQAPAITDHVRWGSALRAIALCRHDDIPGFMKGMTMTFDVAPGGELDGIDRGVKVDFRVKEERGIYTVTEIRPVGL